MGAARGDRRVARAGVAEFPAHGEMGGGAGRVERRRQSWYAAALLAATVLFAATFRQIGRPARVGRAPALALVVAGAVTLVTALFSGCRFRSGRRSHSRTTGRSCISRR